MKLKYDQIKKIAIEYANGNLFITMETIAHNYKVSSSTVSSYIHKAIVECLVDSETATKIAEKAVTQYELRQNQLGYKPNNKLKILYQDLISQMNINLITKFQNIEDLEIERDLLQFQIDTYYETYLDSEEAPDINELIEKLDEISEQILKSTLK